MDWKGIIGKALKGTVGGALTAAAVLLSTGQPIALKPMLCAIGTGAFHGLYKVGKEAGWVKA